jgi:hypothetical protein
VLFVPKEREMASREPNFYAKQMGERGRRRILAEWNYEAQFERVLSRMRADSPAS